MAGTAGRAERGLPKGKCGAGRFEMFQAPDTAGRDLPQCCLNLPQASWYTFFTSKRNVGGIPSETLISPTAHSPWNPMASVSMLDKHPYSVPSGFSIVSMSTCVPITIFSPSDVRYCGLLWPGGHGCTVVMLFAARKTALVLERKNICV